MGPLELGRTEEGGVASAVSVLGAPRRAIREVFGLPILSRREYAHSELFERHREHVGCSPLHRSFLIPGFDREK